MAVTQKVQTSAEGSTNISEPKLVFSGADNPFIGKVINSCIVEVRAKETHFVLPIVKQGSRQIENDYKSWLEIGPTLTQKGKGIRQVFDSLEEEREIMLDILGIDYDKATYTKSVQDYWKGFLIEVSTRSHYPLEVGFKIVDDKLVPLNSRDYAIFRMCLVNATVANNYEERNKGTFIKFYLFTEVQVRENRITAIRIKDKASKLRAEVTLDIDKMNMVLLAANRPTHNDKDSALISIYDFVEENPVEFIRVVESNSLADEALVNWLVSKDIIKRADNSGALFYDNQSIGSNMMSAVQWLRTPVNAETYSFLKMKMTNGSN